jgi:hypothetical protein
MKNKYEVKGNVAYIYLGKSERINEVTIIDAEDLNKFAEIERYITRQYQRKTNSYYAIINQGCNKKSKILALHRVITEVGEGLVVDHINHNTLDNRKCNLRICTNSQNNQNRKGAQVNSKSGIRGVYWVKGTNKWMADISVGGKRIFIGYFKNIEDAKKAVIEARAKHMPYSQEALLGR